MNQRQTSKKYRWGGCNSVSQKAFFPFDVPRKGLGQIKIDYRRTCGINQMYYPAKTTLPYFYRRLYYRFPVTSMRTNMHYWHFAVLWLCLAGACLGIPITLESDGRIAENRQNLEQTSPTVRPALLTPNSGIISIVGDSALDAFCAGNGTAGSSWADAHVIEDLVIDVNYQYKAGIELNFTSRFLILRNCTVNGSRYSNLLPMAGMMLNNCSNVRIENCSLVANVRGMIIEGCQNLELSANYIDSSIDTLYLAGVRFKFCNHVWILNNYFNGSEGIFAVYSSNIEISANYFQLEEAKSVVVGHIRISYNSNIIIQDNILRADNYHEGEDFFRISNSENIVVLNNTGTSFYLSGSSATIIKNNTFITPNFYNDQDHPIGFIGLDRNMNCSFVGNYISRIFTGQNVIGLSSNLNCTIADNIIENGTTGILTLQYFGVPKSNSGNFIFGNFINNCQIGLNISENAEYNVIYNNEFQNSTTQFVDTVPSTTNQFDYAGTGNVWEDYTTQCPAAIAENGVWNISYEVEPSTGVLDHYPLEYRKIIAPLNAFSVSCPSEFTVPSTTNYAEVAFSGGYAPGVHHGAFLAWLNGTLYAGGPLAVGEVQAIDFNDLAPGEYSLVVRAYPEFGDVLERFVSFTVDGAAPPAPVLQTPSQSMSRGNLTLRWNPILPPFASTYRIYVNGSLNATLPVMATEYDYYYYPTITKLYDYYVNSTVIPLNSPGYYYLYITADNAYGSTPSAVIMIAVEPEALYPTNQTGEVDMGVFGGAQIWALAALAAGGFGLGIIVMAIYTKRKPSSGLSTPSGPTGNTKIFTMGPNMPSYMNPQNPPNPPGGSPPSP